jgi:tetratricopeptide (TPR) repeat protein
MGRTPKKKPKDKGHRRLEPRSRAGRGAGVVREETQLRINKAQAAWAQRRFDDAIRIYERALEHEPTSAVLMVDLARAYAMRFRHAEAEALVDRASRLHGEDAELQRMLGRSYVHFQQFDRAIECFRRSLELEPDSPHRARTLYELAQMYERLHKLVEARACGEESLALAPQQPVLQYLLAVVDRREGQIAEAVARLREVTASATAIPETIADAWYQLAAIFDKQGEFAEAWTAAQQAKRTLDRVAGPMKYDAADIAEVSRRTFRTIAVNHFSRWRAEGQAFKVLGSGLALLASHPRSGTTLLEQILDSHPGLISADEVQAMSEVVYLPLCEKRPVGTPVPEILDATTPEEIQSLRQAYYEAMTGMLRQPIGQRILLDKNPALTGLLPLIGRVFPEMKIIFALRDPRDVVVSCFLQQLPLNPVSVNFLTIEQTADSYAAAMRYWLKLREMIGNPWIEVRYEAVVADMEGQSRRTLDFLGLPWDDAVLRYRSRAQEKHVHSPTYEAVTKPVYSSSIGRWRRYRAQLEPCLSTLRPYIEALGYEAE